MARTHAADDFAAIRARMKELRRERLQAERARALGVLEAPRYLRKPNPDTSQAAKPAIGLFGFGAPKERRRVPLCRDHDLFWPVGEQPRN